MGIFNERTPKEWLNIEEKDMEVLQKEIENLPDISMLRDHVNELLNTFRLFRKRPIPQLADQLSHRVRQLQPILSKFNKSTKIMLETEEEALRVESRIANKVIGCLIGDYSNKQTPILFIKDQDNVFGRYSLHTLPQYIPRQHLVIEPDNSGATINVIGNAPTKIISSQDDSGKYPTGKAYSIPFKRKFDVYIHGKKDQDYFGYSIYLYKVTDK